MLERSRRGCVQSHERAHGQSDFLVRRAVPAGARRELEQLGERRSVRDLAEPALEGSLGRAGRLLQERYDLGKERSLHGVQRSARRL
jgi:hypothetical protein